MVTDQAQTGFSFPGIDGRPPKQAVGLLLCASGRLHMEGPADLPRTGDSDVAGYGNVMIKEKVAAEDLTFEAPEVVEHVFKKAPGTTWRVHLNPATRLASFECLVGPCAEICTEQLLCSKHMDEWQKYLDASGASAGGLDGDIAFDGFMDQTCGKWGPKPRWWWREAETKKILIEAVRPK